MLQTQTNSIALFTCLLDQLAQGPVVLAIVTATHGSVVSHVGDKLLVWGDAQSFGDLNDDGIKAAVISQSFAVLKTGIAQRLVLNGGDGLDGAADTVPDRVQVWLTRWQGEDAIATVQVTLSALAVGQPSRLIVPLVTGQFPYVVGCDTPSLRNLQGQDTYMEDL